VRRQSEHGGDYRAALARLSDRGVLYPCFCTRAAIVAEIAAAGAAPHGANGPLYPRPLPRLDPGLRAARLAAGEPHALRLDVAAAAALVGPLGWNERGEGRIAVLPEALGDVVLARKDIAASYHLAVVVDDALQDVTLVTRGRDLFSATHVHRLLQALLALPMPTYHHHMLLADETGDAWPSGTVRWDCGNCAPPGGRPPRSARWPALPTRRRPRSIQVAAPVGGIVENQPPRSPDDDRALRDLRPAAGRHGRHWCWPATTRWWSAWWRPASPASSAPRRS